MRLRTVCVVASALVFLGFVGCRKSNEENGGSTPSVTEQAKQQAGQAMETATKFAGETKDQFVAATQQKLDELQQKYQQWKQQASVQGEQAQQKLGELQAEVEKQLKTASDSLSKAKTAGENAWQTSASTVQEALTQAQSAYDKVVAYVKEQAASATGQE